MRSNGSARRSEAPHRWRSSRETPPSQRRSSSARRRSFHGQGLSAREQGRAQRRRGRSGRGSGRRARAGRYAAGSQSRRAGWSRRPDAGHAREQSRLVAGCPGHLARAVFGSIRPPTVQEVRGLTLTLQGDCCWSMLTEGSSSAPDRCSIDAPATAPAPKTDLSQAQGCRTEYSVPERKGTVIDAKPWRASRT
jgi:hypothetical protein